MKFWKIIICWLFATSITYAGDIDVHVQLDTNQILIGDWVRLKVEISRDESTLVFWPELTGTIQTTDTTELEILSATKIDTVALRDGFIKESITLTLTIFDTGYYIIPPIQFRYQLNGSDSFETVNSEPLLLAVFTVPVDTAQPIRPIKEPLNLPFKFSEIQYYVLAGIVALLLIAGLIYYLKTRKKKPVMVKRIIRKEPPHDTALKKLRQLEEDKLWQKGEVKEYYSGLSEIIREYIEGRYNFLALESTTDEIISKFMAISIDPQLKDKLQDMLQTADLVKFAKSSPLPDEHKRYMGIALEFVQSTKTEAKAENIVEDVEKS